MLTEGGPADLIAFPDARRSPAAALSRATAPALVIVGGKVKLIAPALAKHLRNNGLSPLEVEGRGKFLIAADVPRLVPGRGERSGVKYAWRDG